MGSEPGDQRQLWQHGSDRGMQVRTDRYSQWDGEAWGVIKSGQWNDIFRLWPRQQHNTQTSMKINQSIQHGHFVWKTFCTIRPDFLMPLDARSSSCISPDDRLQPRAPKLSLAWPRSLAPGIGTVPFAMHQLIATCREEETVGNLMPLHLLPAARHGRIDRRLPVT